MTPRVSVLMTVYNAGPYLAPALQSLLDQTFTDWELVAIENGSSDGSAEVLQGFADRDSRIRTVELAANIGRTPALIKALSMARGEYAAVLDADDIAYQQRLEYGVRHLEDNPGVVAIGSDYDLIDSAGAVIEAVHYDQRVSTVESLAWSNPVAHSSAMYRRTAAIAAGGYSADYAYAQDYALWIALAQRGDVHILPLCLAGIRQLPQSLTRRNDFQLVVYGDVIRLLKTAGPLFARTPDAERRHAATLVEAKIQYIRILMYSGRKQQGLLQILSLIAVHPVALSRVVLQRRIRPYFSKIIRA